jgi:pre-rRNA-processing protein TSR2
MDLLEMIMDEQFDTICEDESIKEISSILNKWLNMAKEGQMENVRNEISQLPPCPKWITNTFQVNRREEESSSSDDDDDAEMSTSGNKVQNPSTSGSTMDFEEEDPDPGWTLVKKKGK